MALDPGTVMSGLEALGAPLTDEHRIEIEQWTKGRDLIHTTSTPGWAVVCEVIQSLVTEAMSDLVRLPPGDPNIGMAHAAASANGKFAQDMMARIQSMVSAAEQPPAIVRRGAQIAKQYVDNPTAGL